MPDLTITGDGVDTTCGAPQVAITDAVGNILYQGQPDSISPDKRTLTIAASNLNSLYSGSFYAGIANATSDGQYYVFGGASINVIGGDGRPIDPCLDTVCSY